MWKRRVTLTFGKFSPDLFSLSFKKKKEKLFSASVFFVTIVLEFIASIISSYFFDFKFRFQIFIRSKKEEKYTYLIKLE